MTIYKKLQEARIRLQATPLNKSGVNAFAKYSYFELCIMNKKNFLKYSFLCHLHNKSMNKK
jgi:hypothetical protein